MADIDEREFDAAKARGRAILETEPRAVAARYDAETGRVALDLGNGCTCAFPTGLAEDLQGAKP